MSLSWKRANDFKEQLRIFLHDLKSITWDADAVINLIFVSRVEILTG